MQHDTVVLYINLHISSKSLEPILSNWISYKQLLELLRFRPIILELACFVENRNIRLVFVIRGYI